jgi:hypothetical protein
MISSVTSYTLNVISPADADQFTVGNKIPTSRGPPSPLPNQMVHRGGHLFYYHGNLVSCQPFTDEHISLSRRALSGCDGLGTHTNATVFVELRAESQDNDYVVVHATKKIL